MPIPPPEEDREYVEQIYATTRRAMRGLQAAQAAIGQVVGRAASEDDLVKATAGGRGDITGLRIDPRAMRLHEGELARQVTAVLQAAQQDAALQAQQIASKAMGEVPELPKPLGETFVRARAEQVIRDLL
ncbi:YbaB/EbfC family nucleoid-associated protein [Nonomuraea jiangxiensis]|uniref:YbaB/EbfC DNA-binding family protein n=1 Tax=Nonomuraea jiangxiensis TaxID=633440 RepID=A0A1G8SYZ8_9ACTN|nr:YbaB/EbfC family nucleoid-associated protein [Nonomuraea jiangxiensis]SDJ34481.1 YbaB/EbfC DNA-binding family protein [Nonomuraea jiangxiensis]